MGRFKCCYGHTGYSLRDFEWGAKLRDIPCPEDEPIDRAIENRVRLRVRPKTRVKARGPFDHLLRQGFPFEASQRKSSRGFTIGPRRVIPKTSFVFVYSLSRFRATGS